MNKQNKFKAIVFDMDGVIINSKEYVEEFWIEKLNEHGIHIPEEEREERFHGRPARPTVNDLFAELDESTRKEIIEKCAVHDASVESYPMIPGVDEFIKQCIDAGIRIGLVTSALPGKVDRMLAGLSVSNPFECMVTANLVANGKPSPECYLLAAEKLGVNPKSMIVFEDSVSGVKAASDAGATVIGVNDSKLAESLYDSGAIEQISDFKGVHIERKNGEAHLMSDGLKDSIDFRVSTGE